MQLNGNLTISRPLSSDVNDTYIKIAIQDENSRAVFVEAKIDLADFAQCLTGLSNVPVKMEVGALNKVGKKRIIERVSFKVTTDYLTEKGISKYSKTEMVNLLKTDPDKIFQREGWLLDTYLGSQGSIRFDGDTVIINTHYIAYIEVAE